MEKHLIAVISLFFNGLMALTCICYTDLGLDIQDEMGRHEVGFQENTHKEEINHGGKHDCIMLHKL